MRKSTKGPTTNPSPLERGVPVVQSVAEAAKARSAHRRDKSSSTGDSFSRQHPSATLFQFFCTTPQTRGYLWLARAAYGTWDTSHLAWHVRARRERSILALKPPDRAAARDVGIDNHGGSVAAPCSLRPSRHNEGCHRPFPLSGRL